MSYLVLARKYRPKTFAELVGQAHVVQALTNALRSGRLHHAYLFTGTRGVGKTTVSRILAKSLNCVGPDGTGGVTHAPCGVCDPCRDIDRGRFVDYTELDAASNRGVDEVQSLLEQAVYKPVQGRFKVFMIDEVHMLSGHAFNAMLKTLEEPPEYLKFVLATTDPQKVPVTVLSRCLQFNLAPMAPQTVREHLTEVLASEQVEAEPAALRLIARAARGSMRDALSLTDQAIAFGGGQLQEAPVRQMLGSVDHTHVLRLIEALAVGDARSVIATVDTLRTHGFSAAATLEDMSLLLQRMAVLQAAPALAGARGPVADADDRDDAQADPEAADAARLAARMPADETQLLYSICLHGRAELGLAPDEYTGLTMVLLRLLAFKPGTATTAADAPTAAPSAQKKTPVDIAADAGPSNAAAASAETPKHAVAHEAGAGAADDSGVGPGSTEGTNATDGRAVEGGVNDADAMVTGDASKGAALPNAGAGAVSGERAVAVASSSPARERTSAAVSEAMRPSTQTRSPDSAPVDAGTGVDAPPPVPAESSSVPTSATGEVDTRHADAHPDGLTSADPTAANRQLADAATTADFAGTSAPRNDVVADAGAAGVGDAAAADTDATSASPGTGECDERVEAFGLPTATCSADDLGSFWHQAVQQLAASGTITALVRELALQSQLIAREDRHWTLRVASASLDQPVSRDRLVQALAADGHAVAVLRVEIAAISDSPARRIAAAAEQAQREALARIEGDPFVQSMMRDYGARIVPGSVRAAGAPQRAG